MFEIIVTLREIGDSVREKDDSIVVKSSSIETYSDARKAVAFFNATVENAIDVNSTNKVCDRYYD